MRRSSRRGFVHGKSARGSDYSCCVSPPYSFPHRLQGCQILLVRDVYDLLAYRKCRALTAIRARALVPFEVFCNLETRGISDLIPVCVCVWGGGGGVSAERGVQRTRQRQPDTPVAALLE